MEFAGKDEDDKAGDDDDNDDNDDDDDDNDDDNGDNAQHIDNNNKGSLPSRFSGKVVIEGGGVFRNLKSPKMFTII